MCPKISVIVPIYNVEQYLDQCVQSILNQYYSHLEIILVDDGSEDRCPQMCDDWASKDPRIIVIHKNNGGLSDARNAGLDICTGDYIAFVDSDDWINLGMFLLMMQAIEQEEADLCACGIISCYQDREVRWGNKEYLTGNSEVMLDRLYSDSVFPVCSWNKLYRRELWADLRFPVGKICEDAFTTYLILHKSEKIVQIKEALYYYRIRPKSIMTSSFSKSSMDEEEAWRLNSEFIRQNYPNIYRRAYTFYLQSINVLIHRMNKEDRIQYSKEYEYLRRIISRNIFFMLFRSTASIKYRIKYLRDFVEL